MIIACAAGVALVLHRQYQTGMLDRLGSADAAERAEAIEYWFGSRNRLASNKRMLTRLEDRSDGYSDDALEHIFEDVVRPRNAEWVTLGGKAPLTYYRSIISAVERSPRDPELLRDAETKLDLALQQGAREGGYGLVWDVADAEERKLILDAFLAISRATAADPDAAFSNAAITALSLVGEDALPVLEPSLDAANAAARRQAWLRLGALRPESGYSARWQDAPREVAEAMIAASVVMADDAGAAIERFRADGRVASEFAAVLDALAGLPRDPGGRIDLDADWPVDGGAADLLSDLKSAHDDIGFALGRVRAFRVRDGSAAVP